MQGYEVGGYVAVIIGLMELVKFLIRKRANGNGRNGYCHFTQTEKDQLRDLWVSENKNNMEEVLGRMSTSLTELAMSQKATASIQANMITTQQMILDRLRDIR